MVAVVLVAQSCPTLCNPMNCGPPGSSVHGILQARILEWIAIPFSRGSSRPRDRTWVSCIANRFFTIWATGKIPREGSHSLLQGFFLNQGSNPGLLCCRQILYHLSHWCACMLSCFSRFRLFGTRPCQASLSIGFSKQGYWSGLHYSPPGDLLD